MGNKSRAKWWIVWSAYLLAVMPFAVLALAVYLIKEPFGWLVGQVERLKEHLIRKYKPDEQPDK